MKKFLGILKGYQKKFVNEIVCFLVVYLFKLEKIFYSCKCINYPKVKCMFAMWHAHQCGVFSCNMYKKTCIMVSNSYDGEIISRAANGVGVETVRGSMNRGGAKASLELIKRIQNDDVNGALTIDGPRGPNRIVKKGIVEIAKMANIPIVPCVYWSPQKLFLKFNSWDNFRFPLIGTKLVMLFGDPIYLPENPTDEDVETVRKKTEDELNRLYKDLKENYYSYLKS